MVSRQRQRQEQYRHQQWRSSSSRCLPLMLYTKAAIISFLLASTSSTAAANSRRVQQQQQQSNTDEELIELFDQVTNNQTTVTTTTTIDTTSSNVARIDDDTLDMEEVVSGGIVYASCPDLSAVSGPLYESDTNSDGFINQEEYVQFTDAISGGLLTLNGWEGGFNDMPLSLQETYLVLSCLCELYPGQPWGGVGCCKKNAITGSTDGTGIRTDGAQPGTTPDADQRQYLTYVCGTMSESLESVGGTIVAPPPMTPTPSSAVITSEPTTMQPVFMPTQVPEPTDEPTATETDIPTSKPTRRPTTKRPSKKPTSSPVTIIVPTKSPAVEPPPTASPVVLVPTESPVVLVPTISPSMTSVPSAVPTLTMVPTIDPTQTVAPTLMDSTAPSTELSSNITTPSSSISPSISNSPSISSYPINLPTISSSPSLSGAPSFPAYTGDIPVVVAFVASLNGEITAEEVMEGKTNQVKLILEEQLLVLSDIVIEEEFGNSSTSAVTNTTDATTTTGGATRTIVSSEEPTRLRRRVTTGRILVVEKAISAVVDDVQDAPCPSDVMSTTDKLAGCFNFTNTIILRMVDERNVESQTDIFENAMLTKIADGWLNENFDLEEALKPPTSPTPGPTNTVDRGEVTPTNSQPLSSGAIVGIVIAALIVCMLLVLILIRNRRGSKKDPGDVEMQASPNESEFARDGFDESSAMVDDSSSMEKSFSSQDHLLQGQLSSTADMPPALEKLKSEDESEVDDGYDSAGQFEDKNISGQSALSVMAAASTLVASSSNLSPTSVDSYSTMDVADSSSTMDLASDHSLHISDSLLEKDSGLDSSDAIAGETATDSAQESGVSEMARVGGMSSGTAAAIGAAGTAVAVAAGVAAVGTLQGIRSSDKKEEESKASTSSTPNSTMDDLENAIEAGNWGQVGALAAVLASQGSSLPGKKSSRGAAGLSTTSYDSSAASSSRGSQSNNIDQARAAEIDKLVEAGDWQGVVLAAARFEADQTFDGESVSASASQSSRFTGSGASATTPHSMATGDMSASNVSNQRGQEEIRAEVEALVRRVVPEESDNIDEMLTQFKGREEELVETLRRMQERAIASRARLAVQKSAKLEARAKANPRGTSVSSAQSIASAGSTKSELEQAIEAGNWHAVGLAAQKMSDSSIGDLSSAEKARLRDAISQSPAFSRRARGTPDEIDHLDQLIEQGDWQGVIAAAKRASEGPGEGILDEQDALDQANMWQEIADQSKQEARQGPAGAGDAAAWAISRSLNALNVAEESTAAVRTIHDIADEQSTDASQYESSSYGDSAGRSQDEFGHVI